MPSGLDPVRGALDALLPVGGFTASEVDARVEVVGPRTWWAGALDVEGLLRAALQVTLAAAEEVARRRGCRLRLGSTAERLAANAGSYRHLRVDGRAIEPFAEYSGFVEAADGWIRLHGNYPHHAAVLENVLGVRDRTELLAAVRELPAAEAEARIRSAGGIAGALRSRARWRETPMAAAVDSDPWIRFERGATSSTSAARPLGPATDAPLGGIRVLDLTRVIAGPTASRLLALLGADVLRVDPPAPPELLDQHLDTGAGKRSAVADLRDPAVLQRIHELLDDADILLTGYRPGALAAYGLEAPALAERHPHLVQAGLSAWGRVGPWGGHRGFDSIVQSCVGIGAVYGGPDAHGSWRPGALPVQALDIATGYGLAAAALGLLAVRPDTGGGRAHLSLARTAHALLDAPAPVGDPIDLDVVLTGSDCAHGHLVHVDGPVLQDGSPLPLAPVGEYGGSDLGWWS